MSTSGSISENLTDIDNSSTSIIDSSISIVIKKKRGRKPKPKTEEEPVEKIKKKRGRKPKPKTEEDDIPKIPKKRGRKPKPKTEEDEIPKIPKKRGRKPKDKYGFVPKNQNFTASVNNESDNIILHLPIKSNQIDQNNLLEKKFLEYNPELKDPVPFEKNKDNNFNASPYPFTNEKKIIDNSDLLFENGKKIIDNSDLLFENGKKIIENNNLLFENETFEKQYSDNLDKTKELEFTEEELLENMESDNDLIEIDDNSQNIKCNYNIKTKVKNDSFQNYDTVLQNLYKKRINERINCTNYKKNINETMIQFKQHNSDQSWPKSTNIYCHWCCHEFNDSMPCTLPTSRSGDNFYVTGCFCSPECAASYNFDDNATSSDIWHRYSLLNLLYKKLYSDIKLKIKLAPPRNVLKMFGGPLSIKEFREYNVNYDRKLVINLPPMISIIHQIEETNVEENSSKKNKKFVPLDDIRVKNADNSLRLKRKTPVSVSQNTLENCMSLKYI
jgi:hypothetical protein